MIRNVAGRSRRGKWLCCGIFGALVLLCVAVSGRSAGTVPTGGKVVAVVDGDTVILNSGEKVRYLGVDAPEVAHGTKPASCYGERAKRANSKWVLHQWVQLSYGRAARDRYGRLLAYVLLPDGRCVNELMLATGHAYVYRTAQSFGRWETFLRLQRRAIAARVGLWGSCSAVPASYYVGNRHSFVVHRPQCRFGRTISRRHRATFAMRWEAFRAGYRPCRRCNP